MIVVNVDYRLAPEHLFPIPVKDACMALHWVIHNIERYGGNPTKIVIAGESTGGNLAAAVVSHHLYHRKEALTKSSSSYGSSPIIGVYLVYPPLDVAVPTDGPAKEFANTNGLLTLTGTAK